MTISSSGDLIGSGSYLPVNIGCKARLPSVSLACRDLAEVVCDQKKRKSPLDLILVKSSGDSVEGDS